MDRSSQSQCRIARPDPNFASSSQIVGAPIASLTYSGFQNGLGSRRSLATQGREPVPESLRNCSIAIVQDALRISPYGVQHDVPADFQKMTVFLNQNRLEPTLEQMAYPAMAAVLVFRPY